jgi:hypothetical protein
MAVRLETTIKRFIGLSTDDKPIETDMPAGSSFLESDTGDIYRWDGESWKCGSATNAELAESDANTVTLSYMLIELVRIREILEVTTS